MNRNRGKYKKSLSEKAVGIYEYIKQNPGCTARQLKERFKLPNTSKVNDLISSLDNHEGYLVSEENDKYYVFDKHQLDNQFWITK